jgi:peptide/nickel transport system permease protein
MMSKSAAVSASTADPSPATERGASFLRRARRLLLDVGGVGLSLAATFFGLLVITFVIGRLMPADPVLAAVGDRASVATYNQVKAAMGLDLPIWQQFLRYAWNVLHGDLGMSILTSHPVLHDLTRVFPATVELATVAIVIGVVLGIPLGVWAAVYRNSLLDHVMRVLGLVGYSVPIFWLGIMGLLVFYLELQWVGGPGRIDVYFEGEVPTVTGLVLVDSLLAGDWGLFNNALSHIILPAALLGYYSLAYVSRMTRSLMLEQLNQEYLVTARVKGVSERRIVWRHAFGNIQVPLITVVALAFANILEGSVLTETVFAWPGIGRYITTALLSADMNAVLGGTIVVGTVYVGVNLISDILYRIVDPRAR